MSNRIKFLKTLCLILKGSASSGNYGHAGVPGQRGGSAPGGNAGPVTVQTAKPDKPGFKIPNEFGQKKFVIIPFKNKNGTYSRAINGHVLSNEYKTKEEAFNAPISDAVSRGTFKKPNS